jgi:hypothetical protein
MAKTASNFFKVSSEANAFSRRINPEEAKANLAALERQKKIVYEAIMDQKHTDKNTRKDQVDIGFLFASPIINK